MVGHGPDGSRGVKGFHDSTKGTYLLREFPLANKVPSRDFLTNC